MRTMTQRCSAVGREIIEVCMRDGTIDDYVALTPLAV